MRTIIRGKVLGTMTLAILLLAGNAGAATLTVDYSGGADYTRIQDAIDNASAWDTILVYSGTYYENVNVTKQLILRGVDTGGGKPVVDAGGSGIAITLSAGNSTLERFTAVNSGNMWPSYSGIRVTSNNNMIKDNTASYNFLGIELISSSNNNVTGNNASSNYYGIFLDQASNNNLIGNTASNSHTGIHLEHSSNNNNLTGNIASNNLFGWGISIYDSNNAIYNNYFNNTFNSYVGGGNIWNTTKISGTNIIGGPYLGGNVWAYPNGTGFSQTCADADADGICDSPYALDGNNIDYLPLAYNISIPPPPGGINGSVWTESAPISYWTHQNFAGFFYDPKNNLGAENLSISADVAGMLANRTIPKGQLQYSTMAQPIMLKAVSSGLGMNASTWDYGIAASKGLEQAGPGQAFDGGNYYILGWQGQKYVALNGKIDKLTKLVLEQDTGDMKNLTAGETWDIGEGWALTLNFTDTNATPAQAAFMLSKDGFIKDFKVVSAGTPDAKPIYTYVESNIAGENNVPLFVTYAENITEGNVQLKYTWFISTSVTQITSGDTYGVFTNAQVAYKNLSLSNDNTPIHLSPGSTIPLMDGLYLVVIDSPSLEFYPMMTVTPPPVNQPPVAIFIYSPLNPVVNQPIIFDASPSFDPDGNITSYWWNIGGNIFTTNIVNISFPDGGTYYAELVVTDYNGATSSTAEWIYVSAPPPANDDFNNATVVSGLPFTGAISTIGATTAIDDPYSCVGNYYGHTVWYSFTPAENMRIEVNPAGSDYSPILLAAYQGSRGALYQVACNLVYNQPLVVYAYANQTVFLMVGSYDGNPGGNLNLTVNMIPPLIINLGIDPAGSVNRLTGDAMIHGTLTCSRPVSGSISGNLSQRAGRFTVIRGSFGFQFWCDSNSTTWNATVRGSNGPFNAGKGSAEAFASAYDWTYGDYAADDASAVVQLKGKER